MEILPHFWISYYKENFKNFKNINIIIHLSKNEEYIKYKNIEEIRVPIDYNDKNTLEEQNNIMYQQLNDITDYIHTNIINNHNILLLGYSHKQDIDTIIIAYYIKYGKITIYNSILFLKTKKNDIFIPKCLFYNALNKFYEYNNK